MQDKTIINRLEHIISCHLVHDDWQFEDDFANDLYMDSLDRLVLIQEVEDQFQLNPINEYDLEEITTPGKLLEYLRAHV